MSSGFAGFRFPPEVILLAVRWYLFSLWLRVYLPGRVILDGTYPVPPVAEAA
jgi:hypothetical protein